MKISTDGRVLTTPHPGTVGLRAQLLSSTRLIGAVVILLGMPAAALAQTFSASDQASLETAISAANAAGGTGTIAFTSNITLTSNLASSIDLSLGSITVEGGGFTLSGANTSQGLTVINSAGNFAGTAIIQNLTIANTTAVGGAGVSGGAGAAGGGGGAGMGGALLIQAGAFVSVNNVSLISNTAVGGAGGSGSPGVGGSGGTGGGLNATGTGGGAGGIGGSISNGSNSSGFGGGGGGAALSAAAGGAGNFSATVGPASAGGAGGSTDGTVATSLFGGGSGGTAIGGAGAGGGGGGAALGGGVFVQGGQLTISGPFYVNGNAVTGGAGGAGGGGGSAGSAGSGFGGGLFLDGASLSVSTSSNIAINDAIGGINFASVQKSGTGTLVLGGDNTFAGGLSVSGGTVSVSSDANLGLTGSSIDLANGSGLEITGSGTFSRPMTLSGGGLQMISVTPNQTAVWSGLISEGIEAPAAGLHVAGGGTLALTNATNTFTLGTSVTGNSELVIGADGALGIFGNASVSLGDDTSGGTLGINAPTFSSPRSIVLGSAGGTIDTIGASQATLTGVVSGGGLTKAGTGTLTLAGANTYSGPTTVSAGVLQAGSSSAFGTSRLLTVGAGATADFNGFSQNFFSVSGAGNVALSGGADLTIGGDNSSSSLDTAVSGNGGLVKTGGGTLTVTGANTFTGGMHLNSGALSISSDANLGGGGNLAMSAGTKLNVTAGGLYTHDLALSTGTSLNASPGQAVTWSGVISGNGGLHWNGSGLQLALTNAANSYAGGTSIAGGSTLSVASDGALGAAGAGIFLGDAVSTATLSVSGTVLISRPITMGLLGATIDTPGSANVTIGGAIGGGGGLTKAGTGSLTLNGDNTYTGPTVVQAGRLALGHPAGLSGNGQLFVGSGSIFDLNGFSETVGSIGGGGAVNLGGGATLSLGGDNSSSAFSGVLSGSGGLVKNGNGLLSLAGANTFAGGMTVSGGTVAGSVASLPGNIVNNALVVFDQGSAGTYAGAMSGSGVLGKNGAGALTLAGANTYTGGTLLSAGSIIGTTATLQGAFVNNGELVFDQPGDGTFQGVIVGSGAVTKQGTGLVTINGANGFTGLTQVMGGTLAIDAGLPGDVFVGPNGLLRGAGTIGGSLTVGGRLNIPAPGTSLSTFNASRMGLLALAANQAPSLFVNGNFTTTPGSSLDMTVSPSGAPPIVVAGSANLQLTHLNVTINDSNPARNATYLALTTGQGLTTSGVTASSPTTGLVPILKSDSTSLMLTLLNLQQPFQNVTTTGNGGAAARGLDAVKLGATGDLGAVVRELAALDDAHLNAALRSLSGEIHASTLRLTTMDGQSVTDLTRRQLSQAEHDSEDAPGGSGWRSLHPWIQLGADHSTFDSNGSRGIANVGGGAGGLDFKPASRWTLGGGAALSLGGLSLADVSGSSQLTAPRAFAYSGVGVGPFHFHVGGSGSKSKTTTDRTIQFVAMVPNALGQLVPLSTLNGIDREAAAEESETTRDAWTEFQDTVKRHGWIFDTKIAVRAFHLDRNPFAETGANSIALAGAGDTFTTREATFEGHYYRRTGSWRPNVLVSYRREVGDDTTQADVNFAGDSNSQFTVEGALVPLNTFHGLFALTFHTALGLEYTFEYETQQARGESHNAVHFRMKFR